jgi:hypothetical protein
VNGGQTDSFITEYPFYVCFPIHDRRGESFRMRNSRACAIYVVLFTKIGFTS